MTTNIDNITVLGTGVLGSQIAYQTAYSGFAVIAYDISDKVLEPARVRFEALATRYEHEVSGASGGRAQSALARIRYSSSLADAVRDTDLGARASGRQARALQEARAARTRENNLRHQQFHAAAERAR